MTSALPLATSVPLDEVVIDMHPNAPFNVRMIRVPAWAVPVVIILAVGLLVVAALVSLSLLLVLIPVLLVVGVAQRLFGHRRDRAGLYRRPSDLGSRTGGRMVIDADYEVVDPPSKPKA